MSFARNEFLKGSRSIWDSANDSIVLDLGPSEKKHNRRAQVYRNGLAVVAFACLEHFLKNRAAELMGKIGSSGLHFASLPARMQKAATIDVIDAIKYQSELVRRAGGDQIDYIKSFANPIASYDSAKFSLVPLSLGHSKANLGKDDVKELLKTFDISDGWGQMALLAGRIGSGALGLDSSFQTAATRRHIAAHNPQANCPLIDLRSFIEQSRSIAATFDLLASQATILILNSHTWTGPLDHNCVKLRFLDKTGDYWREMLEGKLKPIRKAKRISEIEYTAIARARNISSPLVIRGAGLKVLRWHTPV